jgi:long-chain acyl-CoA synthetase
MMDLEETLQTSIDESAFAAMSKVADLGRPTPTTKTISQPTYNRTWIARLIRRVLLPTVFLPCTRMFTKLSISGKQNMDGVEGPVVFAANHQSHLDTPVILASLDPRWRYRVAPAMWMEYFDAHFFPERHSFRERWINSILYRLLTVLFNAFPISQAETGTRQSLRYIGSLIEEGWSILIFPEGERTLTGEIGRFYPGVGMIASRMRVPIMPIRVEGLDRVLHRHAQWPQRGPVHIKFGAPLWPHGEAYTDFAKQIEETIRAL